MVDSSNTNVRVSTKPGQLQCPTQVLDTWHRDRRAVGPDRWLTAGLLRQRQPNGQVEAGSVKDLPCTEFGQTRLPHRAAPGQRVGGETYCFQTGWFAALPGRRR